MTWRGVVAAGAVCAAAAASACEPKVRPEYPEPTWEDDERAGVPAGNDLPAAVGVGGAPVMVRASRGKVARARLVEVLDLGPPAFLRGVDVEPTFRADRFAGWQIVSFWPDEPMFASVDLVPGDVVIGVNGRAIETPDQLRELWDALRTATVIEVDYVRGGEPRKLHYDIEN